MGEEQAQRQELAAGRGQPARGNSEKGGNIRREGQRSSRAGRNCSPVEPADPACTLKEVKSHRRPLYKEKHALISILKGLL